MRYENATKFAARELGFRWFLSGTRTARPQYWTLCNYQSASSRSEINQARSMGVIESKAQFHGVDKDAEAIAHNRALHPEAAWFASEWLAALLAAKQRGTFAPSLVYLDTLSQVDLAAAPGLVAWTMRLCPAGTALLVNVLLTQPYVGNRALDGSRFLELVAAQAGPESLQWYKAVERFDYRAGQTVMGTYCFRKGGGR
jgi:hypothetical protein